MPDREINYSTVSLPKDFLEEVKADADKLTKEQNRIKPVSLPEMIITTYRGRKQEGK